MYLDFKFALDNIKEFLFMFWKIQRAKKNTIKKPYYKLKNKDIRIYKECLVKLDQFYFDNDLVHSVAKLHDPSLGPKTIREIGAIYGHLSNIKRSMEVSDRLVYTIAFSSMNHLIKINSNDLTKELSRDDFYMRENIKTIMDKLDDLAQKNTTQSE